MADTSLARKAGLGDTPPLAGGEHAFFTFWLEGEEYGLDLSLVREIVKIKEISVTPLPAAPPFIAGLLSLRGTVIPLVNLKLRLGLSSAPSLPLPEGGRIVVCSFREDAFGLVVDRVSGVVHVTNDRLEDPPEHMSPAQAEFIERIGKYDVRERHRVTEYVPGEGAPAGPESGPPAAAAGGRPSARRIVAILRAQKIVDFGFEEVEGG
ncbi:MAG: purine-binding chemotaxis protein CheW [Nitrospirae bacterium]|nr:purine-binding chemotaxis protein CheW [Nitrospirota bacterium]